MFRMPLSYYCSLMVSISNFLALFFIFVPKMFLTSYDFYTYDFFANVFINLLIMTLLIFPSLFWICAHFEFSKSFFFKIIISLNLYTLILGLTIALSFFGLRTVTVVIEYMIEVGKIIIDAFQVYIDIDLLKLCAGVFKMVIELLINETKDILMGLEGAEHSYFYYWLNPSREDAREDVHLLKEDIENNLFNLFSSMGYDFDFIMYNERFQPALLIALLVRLMWFPFLMYVIFTLLLTFFDRIPSILSWFRNWFRK
jgi:hypothetical protein